MTAPSSSILEIERLAGTLGAMVHDLDLRCVDDAAIGELRAAIVAHKVVVAREQHLDPSEQTTISRHLGPPGAVPFIAPLPDHPEVIAVVKRGDQEGAVNFGGVWHSDFSFQDAPPSFTLLQAVEVPNFGGDTVWANMALAYEALPADERARCDQLTAIHTARDSYGPKMRHVLDQIGGMEIETSDDASIETRHPLVTMHPDSGERVLFFNQGYVRGIDGMSEAEARRYMRFLHDHSTHTQFTFRHRWAVGDLVIWDNRSTQHFAINDYHGQTRRLHRTTVAGTTPVAATRS